LLLNFIIKNFYFLIHIFYNVFLKKISYSDNNEAISLSEKLVVTILLKNLTFKVLIMTVITS